MNFTSALAALLIGCWSPPPPGQAITGDSGSVSDGSTDDGGLDSGSDGGGDDTGTPVDADNDGFTADEDCDDTDDTVYPGADELCDGEDNDCDDAVDEDAVDATTWFLDADGDSFGNDDESTVACDAPEDHVSVGGDCNDGDNAINPDADELCSTVGVDDDCDNVADEDDAVDTSAWYDDFDEDGYGEDASMVLSCEAPEGHVPDGGDCDDTDDRYYPGAPEDDCADPNDYNCDGSVGYADADADGFAACEECDDTDDTINPDAQEVCDEFDTDEDCSGAADDEDPGVDTDGFTVWYRDLDDDGQGDPDVSTGACDEPEFFADNALDCDDGDDTVYTGAAASESSLCTRDADGDGYGDDDVNGTDCDDSNASANPGEDELCSTDYDDDCDGSVNESGAIDASTWYLDEDGDGAGDGGKSTNACEQPDEYVDNTDDCDDTNEYCTTDCTDADSDGYCVTTDCDDDEEEVTEEQTWYHDGDDDDYGDPDDTETACEPSSEDYIDVAGDCDDNNADVNPGVTEDALAQDLDCDGNPINGTEVEDLIVDEGCTVTGESVIDLSDAVFGPLPPSSMSDCDAGSWERVSDYHSYSSTPDVSWTNDPTLGWVCYGVIPSDPSASSGDEMLVLEVETDASVTYAIPFAGGYTGTEVGDGICVTVDGTDLDSSSCATPSGSALETHLAGFWEGDGSSVELEFETPGASDGGFRFSNVFMVPVTCP